MNGKNETALELFDNLINKEMNHTDMLEKDIEAARWFGMKT